MKDTWFYQRSVDTVSVICVPYNYAEEDNHVKKTYINVAKVADYANWDLYKGGDSQAQLQ